ncbi:MAG: 3'-5' exonuclease [Desulfopila sp.]|jgi:DNA polymerase-3 subunit epsilon|nr:3'-5' exonuclease [Desulfopila sp.]
MHIRSKLHNHLVLDWPAILAARRKNARDPRLQEFYAAAGFTKHTPLKNLSFVALDFETTGLNPLQDDIVSIGLVPFNLERIYCSQAAHWFLQPGHPLSEDSIVIHHITHSDIHGAPDLGSVLEKVLLALQGKVVVVHHHLIEREFLDQAVNKRLGEGIRFPVVDTMAIEATVQHRQNGGLLQRLRGRRPLSVRLPDSRLRYGLPPYQLHHALTDALATAELFQAQVAHHFSPDTPLASLWI